MLAEGERPGIVQPLENFPAFACARPSSPPPPRASQAAHRPRSDCFCTHARRPLSLESRFPRTTAFPAPRRSARLARAIRFGSEGNRDSVDRRDIV